jgi:hypothetical protein
LVAIDDRREGGCLNRDRSVASELAIIPLAISVRDVTPSGGIAAVVIDS